VSFKRCAETVKRYCISNLCPRQHAVDGDVLAKDYSLFVVIKIFGNILL